MINRYQVEIRKPTRRRRADWTTCAVRRFKTLGAAESWAARVLARHPNEYTRYGGGDSWEARFSDLKKCRQGFILARGFMGAPSALVPSVGEIGWW
jgi:hypothetical protein